MSDTLHIYTRVSTAAQEDDGTSLDTQKELGFKKAKDLGMEPRLWNEGGQSSKHDDFTNRPVLAQILTEIESGEIKHLWVFNTDRLSRNETTWGVLRLKLVQHDVKLYTASGNFQLSNPLDKLVLGILSEISSYDNYLRAERARLGKLNRLRQGYWIGGNAPYGYKIEGKKLVVNKTEAKWVQFIFEQYHEGKSTQRIRKDLIENGVKPRGGRDIWSLGSLEALMKNTHYYGSYRVTDSKYQETVEIQCEPIISASLRQKFDAARDRRRIVRVGESNLHHFYLLRGTLICDHCGSVLGGRIYPKQYRAVYYCPRRERLRDDPYCKGMKKCAKGPYLRIQQTDDGIWTAVVQVMSDSHRYKEEIKRLTLREKGSTTSRADEIKKISGQVRRLDKEIKSASSSIVNVESDRLLQRRSADQVASIVQSVEKHLKAIKARRQEMLQKIDEVETREKWTDWMSEFGTQISKLKTLIGEGRKDFLKGVVKEIRVRSITSHSFECTIHFVHPYVGDRLVKEDPKAKTQKYKIEDGKSSIVVPLVFPKRETLVS